MSGSDGEFPLDPYLYFHHFSATIRLQFHCIRKQAVSISLPLAACRFYVHSFAWMLLMPLNINMLALIFA